MSWALFCHNYSTIGYAPPTGDCTETAISLFAGTEDASRIGDRENTSFAWSTTGKIMYNQKGYGENRLSIDYGDNWTTPTDYPNPTGGSWADEATECIKYDVINDRFVAVVHIPSVQETYWQFTTDDGEIWQDVDPGGFGSAATTTTYSYPCNVDSATGDFVFAAQRASTGKENFFGYDNPGVGATEVLIEVPTANASNCHRVLELGDNWVDVSWNGSSYDWARAPKDLLTCENRGPAVPGINKRSADNTGSAEDPLILGFISETSATITLCQITESTPVTEDPLTSQTIVFPSNCKFHSVVHCPEIDLWILAALEATTDSDQLMIKTSATGLSGSWSSTTCTITLTNEADDTYSGQIAYRKENTFYIAYKRGSGSTYQNLDYFPLGTYS